MTILVAAIVAGFTWCKLLIYRPKFSAGVAATAQLTLVSAFIYLAGWLFIMLSIFSHFGGLTFYEGLGRIAEDIFAKSGGVFAYFKVAMLSLLAFFIMNLGGHTSEYFLPRSDTQAKNNLRCWPQPSG